MSQSMKETIEKIKQYLKAHAKTVKRLVAIFLVLAVVAAIGVTVYVVKRPYAVLFTGLSGEDSAAIIPFLNESGSTNYRI